MNELKRIAAGIETGTATDEEAKAAAFDLVWWALSERRNAKQALSNAKSIFKHYPFCADALQKFSALLGVASARTEQKGATA